MAGYRISEQAKDDLIRIHRFGAYKFGEPQADKYFLAFFKHFEIIAKDPFHFQAVDYIRKGYMRCVCGVDSIYYRINGEMIEIMAIIGRQDIGDRFS